ncbi:MAG: MerR family transcriptional regulator [Actinobacteria bacterium]|nr:MAG: MerR family transcriptional regulator [Actinomycetota bacterium]
MADKKDRPVYMIGIAAELTGVHPQTLRIYERKRLVQPRRTAKQTRMYSERDIETLRDIQELTREYGLNLAGVELVMGLRKQVAELRKTVEEMASDMERHQREMHDEIERVHKSYRRELVLVPRGKLVKR